MPNFTRRDLIVAISGRTGLTQVDASIIFEGILKAISDVLISGRNIEIRQFGRFKVKARQARNPRTGEVVQVPAGIKPVFRASKMLIKKVNQAS